jgi:hypothetical protein
VVLGLVPAAAAAAAPAAAAAGTPLSTAPTAVPSPFKGPAAAVTDMGGACGSGMRLIWDMADTHAPAELQTEPEGVELMIRAALFMTCKRNPPRQEGMPLQM